MDSRRIATAVLILVSVSHVIQSESCCDDRPWSSWSSCDYPCGTQGTQSRSRINEDCYENCDDHQETRSCSGHLPVDCELSQWSEWNSFSCGLSGRCNFSRFQTSTRHKVKVEGCGGTCGDAVYKKTQQCTCLNEGTRDENDICHCVGDYFGPCCGEGSARDTGDNDNSNNTGK